MREKSGNFLYVSTNGVITSNPKLICDLKCLGSWQFLLDFTSKIGTMGLSPIMDWATKTNFPKRDSWGFFSGDLLYLRN